MRTVILPFALALAASTVALSASADAIKPTTAETTAYRQGQAYMRLFQDVRLDRGACAIVLERARCAEDLQTIGTMLGQDPADARIRQWFVSGDITLRVTNWNSSYLVPPEKAWTSDPVSAWWYTAGVASIAASLPQGKGVDVFIGRISDTLQKHAGAAPADPAILVRSGASSLARLSSVQQTLLQIFPAEAYPEPAFTAGPISYAQLGEYNATFAELFDNPFALSRPDSRAFATVVLSRLQSLHAKFADGLTLAAVQRAIAQPIILDKEWINANLRDPSMRQTINTKWPDVPRKAFLLGSFTAQVAYNAAVLKDPVADATFRRWISTLRPWSSVSAQTRGDIAVLLRIPIVTQGGKWEDINAAATTVTLDIVNPKLPPV